MITALGIASDIISLYIFIIVVGVILSWLFAFNIIHRHNQLVGTTASIIFRVTEPALAPIRRRMPRMSGLDLSPIVLILLLLFIQDMLNTGVSLIAKPTPYWPLLLVMIPLLMLMMKIITLLITIVVIDAILSWLIAFNVINRHNMLVYMIGSATGAIVDPILNPIRRMLPDIGGLDISPLILFFGLMIFRDMVLANIWKFLITTFWL
ncbi:MAG: YggT family protein [Alphaproteobacteria bacterium]